jgi:hypothetical protein
VAARQGRGVRLVQRKEEEEEEEEEVEVEG